MMSFKVTCTCN